MRLCFPICSGIVRERSVTVSKVVTMVNTNRMQRKIVSKTSSKAAPVEPESGSQMLIEERRQHILSLAQRQGRVLVEDLSKSLGIFVVISATPDRIRVEKPEGRGGRACREIDEDGSLLFSQAFDEMDGGVEVAVEGASWKDTVRVASSVEL